MNISSVDIYQYSLELNQPLIIRGQRLQNREGLILHIKSEGGAEGFGEIAPLPGFSRETLSEARNQIQALNFCGQTIPDKIERLDGQFGAWLNNFDLKPSVRFGVESAILHLLANARNIPLFKLIPKIARHQVRIAGLLYGDRKQIILQTKELLARGFTELKLKVEGDIDEAIAKVQAVNDIAHGKALLHLDANQAWDFDRAVTFGKKIGCTAVNYIEEPFKDVQRIPEFFEETLIPVALDESLTYLPFDDVKSISGVEILVLKPTMLGGIEKTWQIIHRAKNFAFDTIVSSSFESSLGISTLVSLAGSSLRNAIAGLDTLKWFKTDVLKKPILIEGGAMHIGKQEIRSQDINFDVLKKL